MIPWGGRGWGGATKTDLVLFPYIPGTDNTSNSDRASALLYLYIGQKFRSGATRKILNIGRLIEFARYQLSPDSPPSGEQNGPKLFSVAPRLYR